MKLKMKLVNEAQLEEIARLMLNPEAVINLDRRDLEYVLVGKCGMLYEAHQEDEEQKVFMKSFFEELGSKPDIKDCHYFILSISVSEKEPLMMEDLDMVHEFLATLKNDELESRWGLKESPKGESMTMIALCTNDTK
jgi:hypothetical protein